MSNISKLQLSGTVINPETQTVNVDITRYRELLSYQCGITTSEEGKSAEEVLSAKLKGLSRHIDHHGGNVKSTIVSMSFLIEYFEMRNYESNAFAESPKVVGNVQLP